MKKQLYLLYFFFLIPYCSYSQWLTSGTNIYNSNTGNIGIGTSTPSEKLHIMGNIRGNSSGGALRIMTQYGYLDVGPQNSYYSQFYTDITRGFYFNNSLTINGNISSYNVSDMNIQTYDGTTYSNRMTIARSNGFIGINKTNPAYQLDVVGTVNATSYLVNGAPLSTSQWTSSGTTINYSSGNVGIGQATPAYKLDVAGSINASSILINGQPFAGGGSQWATVGTSINYLAGNVGIGTSSPDAKLAVKGTIHTNEVKVDLNGAVAPDYVFEKDYTLMSLEDIKSFIDANKHLPEIPSGKEMEENGLQLGEMNLLLLKKVEELTLNLISINERLKQLENENTELRKLKENKK